MSSEIKLENILLSLILTHPPEIAIRQKIYLFEDRGLFRKANALRLEYFGEGVRESIPSDSDFSGAYARFVGL